MHRFQGNKQTVYYVTLLGQCLDNKKSTNTTRHHLPVSKLEGCQNFSERRHFWKITLLQNSLLTVTSQRHALCSSVISRQWTDLLYRPNSNFRLLSFQNISNESKTWKKCVSMGNEPILYFWKKPFLTKSVCRILLKENMVLWIKQWHFSFELWYWCIWRWPQLTL